MAHIRAIKPEFFLDDEIARFSPLVRLAFIGLCTLADAEGYLEYKPKRLKVQVLPYDECDFESIVDTLAEDGFVFFCKDEFGDPYIEITDFKTYIQID